jgi:hypothetical protein
LSAEQVSLKELIKDPIYRQWLKTPPVGGFPKWAKFRVYAQRDRGGRWAKKDFDDFITAYNFLARNLKDWYDAALVSRTYVCRPPVVRVDGKRAYYAPVLTVDGHKWCPYCRRPTVFANFSEHHAFFHTNLRPLGFKKRCSVCGISETAIKEYTAKGTE